MSLKQFILFNYIKVSRYIFKKKFIRVFDGPLKNYLWSTSYNYDYIMGNYEDKHTLELFCSWLKKDSVVYDLGANIGYYALIANRTIVEGTIYSFEPLPANIEIFNKHLDLNRNYIVNDNIQLFSYAISNKDGEVSFSNDTEKLEGNTYVKKENGLSGEKDVLTVKSYSIDSLLRQGFKKPDIMKIDVEGAEYDVLMGAKETISTHHPKILLATHDIHLPGVKDQCLQFLTALGYTILPVSTEGKIAPGMEDFIGIYK